MFGIKKMSLLILSVAIIIWSGAAWAADYVVDDGLLYQVEGNNKKQVDGAEVSLVEFEGGQGQVYWTGVTPDEHKVTESGIYFFDAGGRLISILKQEQANTCNVQFNSTGEKFILDCGTYVDRSYDLYTFQGFEKKEHFYGFSQLQWLDPHRFIFSQIDETKKRAPNADIQGWISVVVYDSAVNLLIPVEAATATEDFIFNAANVDENKIFITRRFVKAEKDWADEEKIEQEEIEISAPAAG